jgi:hypothetical protein
MKYYLLFVPFYLFFACQPEKQNKTIQKPYTQLDTVYVSKYTKYDRETFNRIVDAFPNLYQYPPIHPDSAFTQKTYFEYIENGKKQYIDFDVTGNTIDFYDLYAGFLRQKSKPNLAEWQKLNQNLISLAKIHDFLGEPTQTNWLSEGKIPAFVQYGLYLQSTQKQTNPTGFEQRKVAYHNYLKSLMKVARFDDVLNGQEKYFLKLVYDINIENDFDIGQCKAFEALYDMEE